MKKYFTIALLSGAMLSFTTASALNCASNSDNLITEVSKEKKKKKKKKSEMTEKKCSGKKGASGCCAGGAKKES